MIPILYTTYKPTSVTYFRKIFAKNIFKFSIYYVSLHKKNEEIHNGKRNIYAVSDNLTTVLTFWSVYFPKGFRFTHKNAAGPMHESHFKKTSRVILVFELPQSFWLRQKNFNMSLSYKVEGTNKTFLLTEYLISNSKRIRNIKDKQTCVFNVKPMIGYLFPFSSSHRRCSI